MNVAYRNKFIVCLVSILLLFSAASFAKEGGEYVIGVSVWTGYPKSVQGFKDGLKEAGIIEGKNLKIIYRKSGIDKEKQKGIAEEFKKANVDLVYTLTTSGTSIIKEIVPSTMPVVFSIVTYPADSGLIESFEYSANNLVGTSNFVPFRHYVRLLGDLLPNAKRVAIFHRKGEPNSKIQSTNIRRLLRKKGITVIDQEPVDLSDVKKMAGALEGKVDAFITTTDTLMQGGGEKILIEASLAQKVPILSSNKNGIEMGSTFGPVADFYTLGKMSGEMASKILVDNIKPSALESKTQDPPLILVNKKSAEFLNIDIPSILSNVDYVD
ncbi:hypothetical protein A9Q99_25970 [Gammaproteobacteria bacterium 45_16_T64]|nr:hypothetical protein A9Q99_25970 [Gammaproteobacteria bacterium 45_16_T64]